MTALKARLLVISALLISIGIIMLTYEVCFVQKVEHEIKQLNRIKIEPNQWRVMIG